MFSTPQRHSDLDVTRQFVSSAINNDRCCIKFLSSDTLISLMTVYVLLNR